MALILEVKVIPSSGRLAAALDASCTLKVYLKSPPEDGKANRELISFIARSVGLTLAEVSLVSGATSRKKKIKIDSALTYDEVLSKLGVAVQKTITNG